MLKERREWLYEQKEMNMGKFPKDCKGFYDRFKTEMPKEGDDDDDDDGKKEKKKKNGEKKKKGKGSRGAADVTRIGKADCAFRRDAGRTILGAMSEASVMVFSGGGPACEWRSRDAIGVSR